MNCLDSSELRIARGRGGEVEKTNSVSGRLEYVSREGRECYVAAIVGTELDRLASRPSTMRCMFFNSSIDSFVGHLILGVDLAFLSTELAGEAARFGERR